MDRGTYHPCYTCRNRRIQCDQSGVPCGKCQKAGLECLDKRPFKWVKGVAIRGKLQGHLYENANPSSSIGKDKPLGSTNTKRALVRASVRRDQRFDSSGMDNIGLFFCFPLRVLVFQPLQILEAHFLREIFLEIVIDRALTRVYRDHL
jgi:hypothetical protein